MAVTIYHFRPGHVVPGGDPQKVGERIEELKQRNVSAAYPLGHVTPEEILADARHKRSPLHKCYDWNVENAAEAHWLDVSRRLIGCYEVRIIESKQKPVNLNPANVRVHPRGETPRYVTSSFAIGKPDLRSQVIRGALTMIRGLRNRLANLGCLSDLTLGLFDQVLDALETEANGVAEDQEAA